MAEHGGQPLFVQVCAVAGNICTRAQHGGSDPFADHVDADLDSALGKPQLVVHQPLLFPSPRWIAGGPLTLAFTEALLAAISEHAVLGLPTSFHRERSRSERRRT